MRIDGTRSVAGLLKLRVFRFCSDEDGNVRICVFPKREEILIGGAGFRGVALQHVRAGKAEMRERADGFGQHSPTMVEDFLEFDDGFGATM